MSKFTTFPDDLCQRACQPRHDRLQVLGDILAERAIKSFAFLCRVALLSLQQDPTFSVVSARL